jgi:hypothetical protein
LPVPSVFLVEAGGTIRWTHSDPDYRVRPDNASILTAARGAKPEAESASEADVEAETETATETETQPAAETETETAAEPEAATEVDSEIESADP